MVQAHRALGPKLGGSLAALALLGSLALATPAPVLADYAAAIPWLSMPISVPATSTVVPLSGSFLPVGGTGVVWGLEFSSGGPVSTGLWCDSGAVNLSTNPYNGSNATVSKTMPTGSYTGCVIYGWANGSGTNATTVSYAEGLYTAAGTAPTPPPGAPDPTATPRPRSSPGPTAPPVPSGSFGTTTDCLHAYRWTDTDGTYGDAIHCAWWTYDNVVTDGDGTDGSELGPFWNDIAYYGCGQDEFSGFKVCAINNSAPVWTGALTFSRARPIPAGYQSVRVRMNHPSSGDESGYDGVVYMAINFYTAGTETHRALETFTVSDGNPEFPSSEVYTIPPGVDRIGVTVGCVSGGVCDSDEDGNHRFDLVQLDWYELTGEEVEEDEDACNIVLLPGTTPNAACPGNPTFDPNTGQQVCGPLSGDCDKPFLAPVFVPHCDPPENPLNAVGWLSYIGCLVEAMFSHILNVAIMAVNAIIDLLFPGTIDDALESLDTTVKSRAVFAWVTPLQAELDAALEPGSAPVTFETIEFAGQEVTYGQTIDTVMTALAPARPALFGIVVLGLLLKFRARVLSILGDNSAANQKGVA